MRQHRNPVRPKVPKQPTTNNPPRRRRGRHPQEMLATFGQIVRENPRLAAATLAVLDVIADADRPRVMRFIESASALVVASPRRAP